ncbi:MAG: dipeptidase PepE [Candidatus Sericytochromatia bacterium]
MSRQVLLISTSRIYGQGYMQYCQSEVLDFLGEVRDLLFVPYASQDHQAYFEKVSVHLGAMGIRVSSIHQSADPQTAVSEAQAIFVGGGNTFLLVRSLYEQGLIPVVRERVLSGQLRYMGSSAGSNVAGPTMKTTNDMPIVYPPSFDTFGLVPFQMNPHYQDPLPDSTHMGETREDRIREFHQWNSAPVVGLREGGLIEVQGDTATLTGVSGARLFRAGQEPEEFAVGADLSFLL